MTNNSFQIVNLRGLRTARKDSDSTLTSIWSEIDNDQFFSLQEYYGTAFGAELRGYHFQEESRTYENVQLLLTWLQQIVGVMNECAELVAIADAKAAGEMFQPSNEAILAFDSAAKNFGDTVGMRQLISEVRGDIEQWMALNEKNISKLIIYAPVPTLIDTEVVFSGGGMRAAAFSLGTSLYLIDSSRHKEVAQISSVSGGSITNGFLALSFTSDRGIKEQSLCNFARRLADGGIPLEEWGRSVVANVVVSIFAAIAALVVLFFVALDWGPSLLLPYAALLFFVSLILGFLAFRQFQLITSSRLGIWMSKIISGASTPCQLRDIVSPITHVFTATDLEHGEHMHFSQSWVASQTFGSTGPAGLPIDEIVRASAAFPGALPPVSIPISKLKFDPKKTARVKAIRLVDGGVRDNLGHAFQTKLQLRDDPLIRALTKNGSIKQTIIVDASAPRGVADLSESILSKLPLLKHIKQFVAFPLVIGIMNQSNSEARSLALTNLFDIDDSGFVVDIKKSPFDVCSDFIGDTEAVRKLLDVTGRQSLLTDERKIRASDALRALIRVDPSPEPAWERCCNANQKLPTTLDSLKIDSASDLIRHGYVLAMVQCHIRLDWPLMDDDKWRRDRFVKLINDGVSP